HGRGAFGGDVHAVFGFEHVAPVGHHFADGSVRRAEDVPFECGGENRFAHDTAADDRDLHSRSPKMARPTRTWVAPSSIATSKSFVMPIERMGRLWRSASWRMVRNTGRTSSGSAVSGATVIRPSTAMVG